MEKRWWQQDFLTLYSMHTSFVAADTIGWSLAMLYFYKHGVPLAWLFIFFLVQFGTIYVVLINAHRFVARHMFIYSFCIRILVLLLLSIFFKPSLVYIAAALQATAIFAYWVPFNAIYFKDSEGKQQTFLAALYAGITPTLGLVLPPLMGVVAESFGYSTVFLLGALVMFIPLTLSFKMPMHTIEFNASKSAVRHKKVSMLIFLNGLLDSIAIVAIPLFVLQFITSEIKLGIFLSYLGLAGIIGSLILTRISDIFHAKRLFIFPLTIFLGVIIMLLGFYAHNFYLFLIFAGIFSMINVLVYPFLIRVAFDSYSHITDAVIARETILYLGRFAGVLLLTASFVWLNTPSYAFIIVGTATMLYPYFIWKNKLYA